MNFEFSAEQLQLKDEARRILADLSSFAAVRDSSNNNESSSTNMLHHHLSAARRRRAVRRHRRRVQQQQHDERRPTVRRRALALPPLQAQPEMLARQRRALHVQELRAVRCAKAGRTPAQVAV